ncbi:hypothetical protein EVAR_67095_1 [Eumeta japonica]|uniref:Uncharacterized protein n=1 Tax=Eumeta variegata TaxID=151549 RepID=A0A4C1ZU00_EUMVA|nr:hypothetical protein EVAR_67095_1 [Eumeta japonica]
MKYLATEYFGSVYSNKKSITTTSIIDSEPFGSRAKRSTAELLPRHGDAGAGDVRAARAVPAACLPGRGSS